MRNEATQYDTSEYYVISLRINFDIMRRKTSGLDRTGADGI